MNTKQIIQIGFLVFSVWDFGSEYMDEYIDSYEYHRFNQVMQCESVSDTHVRCKIADNTWIENETSDKYESNGPLQNKPFGDIREYDTRD